MLVYCPILMIALVAWSLGFRNGCRHGDEYVPVKKRVADAAE